MNSISTPLRHGFTLIELLVVILMISMMIALLLPGVQALRESSRRNQCLHNMMNVSLAIRNHEETMGLLPSGTVEAAGPIRNVPVGDHIGWIPRILPFMEQLPLYNEIDFEKGVYAPENEIPWTHSVPAVFICPTERGGANLHPNYMACHDGVEIPIDRDNRGTFYLGSKLRSRDIEDGASNTIFLGEGNTIFPTKSKSIVSTDTVYASLGWMSGSPGTLRNTGTPVQSPGPFADWPMPFHDNQICYENFPYKAKNAPQGTKEPPKNLWEKESPDQLYVGGYGSLHPGGFNVGMGDGSVRRIDRGIDAEIYRMLGRRNDSTKSSSFENGG